MSNLREAAQQAPSIEAARSMGEKGGPAVEAERLAFEAWMAGHCWQVSQTWDGKQYGDRPEYRESKSLDPLAMHTRQLWAAWRDRAALAQPDDKAQPVASSALVEVIGCFEAAFTEGLELALAETKDERLKDLVERRLMYALYAAQNAAPQPPAEQGAESVDYPPLPEPLVRIDQSDDEMWGELQEHAWDSDFTLKLNDPLFTADQMRAYVDTDRVARGGARSTQLLDQIRRQRVRGQGGAA